ncbi:MAG: efflux RND transporter permease subunit, partial [Burkholderiales bacterium]|nr:efflux RND transporter permease subunit [Burkholderiales bacterium]
AALQVSAALGQILPSLPAGTQVATRRMDLTVFPIIAYSLTSHAQSPSQLRELAQYQLRPLLSSVPGVARVTVQGGEVEEWQVTVDPALLQARGLALSDVTQALSAANTLGAIGRIEDRYRLYLVISDNPLVHLDELRSLVVRTTPSGVVRLGDVSRIERGVMPQWQRVNADGQPAVLLSIYQQPGSNSVQIAADIGKALAEHAAQLPPGVKLANWYDQSRLVVSSAASVRDAILIGIGLAGMVLYAFLRNVKITLIAVLVVPAVLATTVVVLQVMHMSFNIMTLGGMAAAVGLIIDDAIVMTEHIVRRLRGSAAATSKHESVMRAALEFAKPLAGSSAATLVIFVPLAFLTGVTGAFFKALSLTMAAGLAISFVVTWLAVPILAEHFLSERDAEHDEVGPLTAWVHARYTALMQVLLVHPWWILVGLLPLLAGGLLAYNQVGSGFMPSLDEGGFILDYRSAPGTALSETNRLVQQVEAIVRATPEVQTYSRRTGTQLGGGLTEANEGDMFIRLKGLPRRPIDEVMDDIRTRVKAQVPGLSIEMGQLMEDVIGDLTAVPQPVEVKIYTDDPAQLQLVAGRIAQAIGRIPGVVDVRDGINPAGDALDIQLDRTRLALEGMDADSVTRTLSDAIGGNVATQVLRGPQIIGIRAWVEAKQRATPEELGQLMLRAPDGHLFPLRRVATIKPITGQPQITRENLKRMVAVTARISGRSLGAVVADVKGALAKPGLVPKGVYTSLGGLYEQQQIAFRGLITVFVAAIALVFLLLVFLYERFSIAVAILGMPLLAVSGVFLGLWATGIELNISAMMGLTMIVGIVTEVAIFYFSEHQDLIAQGTHPQEALIAAGRNRMRPIAMTTLAAILTLLPLAFALGQGSAMQQPLAVAIIAGLVVQLPLVLVVMPLMFYLMHGHPWNQRRKSE